MVYLVLRNLLNMLSLAVFSVQRSVNLRWICPTIAEIITDWKGDVRISYFETELGCAL